MYRLLTASFTFLSFLLLVGAVSAQAPQNVQPTFHCLAAPCPITPSAAMPQTTNVTQSISTSPQNRTAANPSNALQPCDNSVTDVSDHTNKHKKKKNGNVGKSVDSLIKELIDLLEQLVKALGGESKPNTTQKASPKSSKKPCDEPKQKKQAAKPAVSKPAASKAPSSSPKPSTQNSQPTTQPSSRPAQPSVQPSTQTPQPSTQPAAAAAIKPSTPAPPSNAGITCTGTECAFKFVTKYVRISSKFGPRGGKVHKGTDLAGPRGTPIKALEPGVILQSKATPDAGTGYAVEMKDDNGRKHYYMHFAEKSKVTVGQRVNRGDEIGLMDSTGDSTGDHLHFQITKPNSMDYIDAEQELVKWPQY